MQRRSRQRSRSNRVDASHASLPFVHAAKIILLWLPSVFVLLGAVDGHAQTSVQIPLQFDFLNPGAKSLAVGGSFVGLADDATAGFANPAGLRELSRPEISIEVRGRRLESEFLQAGRLSGEVQREGTDTIAGPVFGKSPDPNVGLSYFAAVYASPRHRWAIAGFRHEVARVDQVFQSQGVFQQDPRELTSRREPPQEGTRTLAITSYSGAAAIELNSRMAVGATINLYTFELVSQFRRFDIDGFFGPPILTTEIARATQGGDGTSVAPSVGFRGCLKRCDDRGTTSLRGGVVYRHGPTFDIETQATTSSRQGQFRVPHVLAMGAALEMPDESGRRMMLMLDVVRIGYSRTLEDFVLDQARSSGVENNVSIEDGTEIHVGFQYSPSPERWRWLPRYRVGVWSDPDHSVNYSVPAPGTSAEIRLRDERLSVALSSGGRTLHYAGGLGLSFSPKIEWNIGADFSSRANTVSTSLIVKLRQ